MNLDKIPSPCYVLERQILQQRLELISKTAADASCEIILALKGFALWKLFPEMKPFVSGITASSLNEARLAFNGFGKKVHLYAPAYKDDEIQSLLEIASHLSFNSLSQFEHHRNALKKFPEISVGLRVNPELSQVETELYNPCAKGSRLGIPLEDLPQNLPQEIEGLHVHALCESDAESSEQLIAEVDKKFAKFLPQLKWLNLGGGHLLTRENYELPRLISAIKNLKNKYPNLHIILEPSAAFVWQTGFLMATILDIVRRHGITTLLLDVSFTAHMPDCLEMPYKPRLRYAHEPQQNEPRYRLGGNSCLAGDFLGDYAFDTEPQIGDRLIFEDMIHYTTVKTTMFNGVQHPSIGVLDNGEFRLLKKFSFEDYRDRMC